MEYFLHTPVLLIGFNRPDVIRESFKFIRKAKPQKLFVALDGPRKEKDGEHQLVDDVRHIVEQVDWKCETHYMFNEENKGAEVTVSSAVSWVLQKEETVIVLEDDIIAPIAFFRFAQEMLLRYAENEKVYMVSSNQWTPFQMPNDEDYLFGIYGHTWGWATWKRAWQRFDLNVGDFKSVLKRIESDSLVNSKKEKWFWKNIIRGFQDRGQGKSTWDYCWSYIRFKEQGLSIIPKYNLTSNIGVVGLHASGATKHHFRPYNADYFASKHPQTICRNFDYDQLHLSEYLMKPYTLMVRLKIALKLCFKLLKKK